VGNNIKEDDTSQRTFMYFLPAPKSHMEIPSSICNYMMGVLSGIYN
jgi:hypothetical protein